MNTPKDGEVLFGQLLDKDFRLAIPYTQQIRNFKRDGAAPEYLMEGAELTPIDANATEVKLFNYTALDAAKLAYFVKNPGYANIQFPRELVSLTSVFATSKGTGAGTGTPAANSTGTSWSVGVSSSNHASSSLDYVPDLLPEWKIVDGDNTETIECEFYTSGSKTLAEILTILSTKIGTSVLAWPRFKLVEHSINLKGQSLSVSTAANLQLSGSASPNGTSLSKNAVGDYSIETRSNVRTLDLPACIHGALSITGDYTKSDTITVSAGTSLTGTGEIVGSVTSGVSVPTQTVTALITPHSWSATSITSVPTSGLRLRELRSQDDGGGLFLQLATIVDFSQFA